MKYSELQIQTYRTAPAEMRGKGAEFLFRAGYIDRQLNLTGLGHFTANLLSNRIPEHLAPGVYQEFGGLTVIGNSTDKRYLMSKNGRIEILYCESCHFGECTDKVQVLKRSNSEEEPKLLEKILTPECHTIKALADFLNIPENKTAKALLYTREADGKVIFVVIRGDQQLSLSKLESIVGKIRLAFPSEIIEIGSVPGFASPIGISNALIVIDKLIERTPNLVAGANEAGYHLLNTNYGRDYSAQIVADLTIAVAGDECPNCGKALLTGTAYEFSRSEFPLLLVAIAEINNDDRGLIFNRFCSPADIYLMNIPGKELDTQSKLADLENLLLENGFSVLVDDRNERAGIKFADADLIGCPLRIAVGERGLVEESVEVKNRASSESILVKIVDLPNYLSIGFVEGN